MKVLSYQVSAPNLGFFLPASTYKEAKKKRKNLKNAGVTQTYIKRKKGVTRLSDY